MLPRDCAELSGNPMRSADSAGTSSSQLRRSMTQPPARHSRSEFAMYWAAAMHCCLQTSRSRRASAPAGSPASSDQLVRAADHAMYESKVLGGDRVQIADLPNAA